MSREDMEQPAERDTAQAITPGPPAPAVRTTCPYCGVGCGVLARANGDGVTIAGDPAHPANYGRLCVKGSALGETVGLHGRLLHPQLRDSDGNRRRATWDEALQRVADGFHRTIAEHGPDAVAFYVSGQLLTEDYYVANKLMKGYIGSANIDTNSRLCMSSAVAGYKRAFGEDVVPVDYEDLEAAELIVLVGSNTAWCHPVIYQRIIAARQRRPALRIVVIDPRRTASCEEADLHLPLKPGSDVALFNGLLVDLQRRGCVDAAFVAEHTQGATEALAAARRDCPDVARTAERCGLEVATVQRFFDWFVATPRVVTAFSQGVNQSSAGTDKVNAIVNCHLLSGRIGRRGAGPFSITGQPNAMGGREVGGLANQLAAHLELDLASHRELVQTFWNSPQIASRPGHKAVDLFDAVDDGRIKAIWIMATNPVVSLPDADRVRSALQRCPLVVVSDIMQHTDTAQLAHVLLPATGWGERDGTVTNSERCISRQQPFLPPPGEARHDWQIICDVAARLGHRDGFTYTSAHEIFDEHARLTAWRNDASGVHRQLNLSGLTGLDRKAYDALAPVRWPVIQRAGAAPPTSAPAPFADARYSTADGRARLVAVSVRKPAHQADTRFPLVLNTGRVRDHWHTMTRTGKSPRLASHVAEPFVEINPQDAEAAGIVDGQLARVCTRWGSCVVRAQRLASTPRGQLFVPIHWNDQTASDARVGALVNPAVDPLSGEPEFKHTPATVEPVPVDWYGFVLMRTKQPVTTGLPADDEGLLSRWLPSSVSWWTRVQARDAVRIELAGSGAVGTWSDWLTARAAVMDSACEWIESCDDAAHNYRAALIDPAGLRLCVFLGARPDQLPQRDWLGSLFSGGRLLSDDERAALLAGFSPGAARDDGPIVCSCHNIGRRAIERAILDRGLRSVQTLGDALKCGTNCGSCIPELRQILARAGAQEPISTSA